MGPGALGFTESPGECALRHIFLGYSVISTKGSLSDSLEFRILGQRPGSPQGPADSRGRFLNPGIQIFSLETPEREQLVLENTQERDT